MYAKTRVLLCENHALLRRALRSLLNSDAEIQVVGEICDAEEALEQVAQLRPDVVVMDIGQPWINSLEAARRIKERFPQCQVVLLTSDFLSPELTKMASVCVFKSRLDTELVPAIHMIRRWQQAAKCARITTLESARGEEVQTTCKSPGLRQSKSSQ